MIGERQKMEEAVNSEKTLLTLLSTIETDSFQVLEKIPDDVLRILPASICIPLCLVAIAPSVITQEVINYMQANSVDLHVYLGVEAGYYKNMLIFTPENAPGFIRKVVIARIRAEQAWKKARAKRRWEKLHICA